MRIISKFQDYYDTALGHGIDKDLVYVRTSENGGEFFASGFEWYGSFGEKIHYLFDRDGVRYEVLTKLHPVIFCGKPYLRYIAWFRLGYPKGCVHQVTNGSTRKEALSKLREANDLKDRDKARRSKWYRQFQTRKDAVLQFEDWFLSQDWTQLCVAEKCPVMTFQLSEGQRSVYRQDTAKFQIFKNPNLQELGFYRVIDAFSAFQEISMFLGGVMGSEGRPMVKLTDAEVHAKHGFDKWSFRKMPG